MAKKTMDPKDLAKVYDEVSEDSGKFRQLIEKNAMDPARIEEMFNRNYSADARYPELSNVEEMTSGEYAALYRKMAEDVKTNPGEFEAHIKHLGMTPDELSTLLNQISGGVEKYPEIWESNEKAQMLHPKNLSMLASAFKEDTAEAFSRIKGFEK